MHLLESFLSPGHHGVVPDFLGSTTSALQRRGSHQQPWRFSKAPFVHLPLCEGADWTPVPGKAERVDGAAWHCCFALRQPCAEDGAQHVGFASPRQWVVELSSAGLCPGLSRLGGDCGKDVCLQAMEFVMTDGSGNWGKAGGCSLSALLPGFLRQRCVTRRTSMARTCLLQAA